MNFTLHGINDEWAPKQWMKERAQRWMTLNSLTREQAWMRLCVRSEGGGKKVNVLLSSTAGQRFYTLTSRGIKRELNSPPKLSTVNSLLSYKSACARAASRPTHETQGGFSPDLFLFLFFLRSPKVQTTRKVYTMVPTPVSDAEDWKVRFKMNTNGSILANISSLPPHELPLSRPPWLSCTLGSVLIFTIVVDILGNLLVIFSVYRNKKLRNAGKSLLPGYPYFHTSLSQHHSAARAACMHARA